jgi:hypothetical protein
MENRRYVFVARSTQAAENDALASKAPKRAVGKILHSVAEMLCQASSHEVIASIKVLS